MNQFDIEDLLDKALMDAESDLERAFNRRLREILFRVSDWYRKYEKDGVLTYTELTKYNRYQKEMALIAKELTAHYREIIKLIQEQQEYQYVTKYLMTAYLLQQTLGPSTDLGFTIPSSTVIQKAIINPIAELTLLKTLEVHRNEIVRKINIEITQSLIAGEGYADMAKRISDAVGFSRKKALTVARTESGRVRSLAADEVYERVNQETDSVLQKVWVSMLDLRVRTAHRKLDGNKSDKKGYFHYLALKAKGPRLWGNAAMDINCRCVLIVTIDGKLPEYRRERDYMDDKYQTRLAAKMDQLMADEGLTYKQAFKKATKSVKPPQRVIDYVTYDEWFDKLPKGA